MGTSNEYTLEFLPIALNDITEIVSSFVILGSKKSAIRIKDKINKAAEQIFHFPYSGVTVPDSKMAKQGFRIIVVEKYIMIYRIFEDENKIVFYRVLNGKRDYPTLMKKFENDFLL